MSINAKNISKTRKFVGDGVFYAELNEFLTRQLGEDGYAGVEIRVTPIRTEVIVRVTRIREVLGEKGRRIRELTSLVQKRFGFKENTVELFGEQVKNRACCAMAQAESLRFKLLAGLPVRRAAHNVMNFVMRAGATGCEVVVSGKLRAQRAKVMKFRDGYLISTGNPKDHYIQESVRHVAMRQGMLGVKVKIMLAYDPKGEHGGCTKQMPDKIIITKPKPEAPLPTPEETAYEEEAPAQEYQEAAAPAAEEKKDDYYSQGYQSYDNNQSGGYYNNQSYDKNQGGNSW
jgi:small subunit ribosomal protein S3e